MIVEKKEDRIYLKSKLLSDCGIRHAFTTACGGESRGKVRGMNLGFRVGDDSESVRRNYMHAAEDNGFRYERITAARQTHSANVRIINEADAGYGVSRDGDISDTDGMVTDCRNLPLVVFYADCVPILLADAEAGVAAAVHSGWRGTAARISENAVRIMIDKFGAAAENIRAAIGPSIGPCCFECGSETAECFDTAFVKDGKNGKYMVDLWEANRRILTDCGLRNENIDVFGLCTVCGGIELYSYRRMREATGRMGAFITL